MDSSKINIIYEDNHLLVVEKPPNVPSQEDDTKDLDMLTLLKQYIKEKYDKPGSVFLGLVHRLDRPVGGAMVFAKTSKAASRLSEQIRNREFKKEYLAVTNGEIVQKNGLLKHYLIKDSKTNIVKVVNENKDKSLEAVLEYNVLDIKDKLSLVRVNLHTGRPHQIRVQFSTIGHPLYGDQKYGLKVNKVGQQIALWSNTITFSHPITKESMIFKSNPPNKYPWNIFDYNM